MRRPVGQADAVPRPAEPARQTRQDGLDPGDLRQMIEVTIAREEVETVLHG
jgi:hypothetical protein